MAFVTSNVMLSEDWGGTASELSDASNLLPKWRLVPQLQAGGDERSVTGHVLFSAAENCLPNRLEFDNRQSDRYNSWL